VVGRGQVRSGLVPELFCWCWGNSQKPG